MKKYLVMAFAFMLSVVAQAQWKPAGERIKTAWAEEIDVNNVLPEYPRPIMERGEWKNLNGLWQYAVIEKGSALPEAYEGDILVPFAIESSLSGVARRINERQELVYKRTFEVPAAWRGRQVLLHFGAVDWKAEVWVNRGEGGQSHRRLCTLLVRYHSRPKQEGKQLACGQGVGPHRPWIPAYRQAARQPRRHMVYSRIGYLADRMDGAGREETHRSAPHRPQH